MDRYLLIACGAALGGMLRHALGSAVSERLGAHFPLGTMLVNLSGCFLIGVLMTMLDRTGARWGFLLITGLLGGYTTFSSFGWETYVLIRDGFVFRALGYSLGSVTGGILAVWLGTFAGRI